MKMGKAKSVNEYIVNAPKEMRGTLKELRQLIKKLVPEAEERISYGMPFYDYKGRLVYFSAAKTYIGLYIPPPILTEHARDLKSYTTTKSALHLSVSNLPVSLIKKLIRARMKYNEAKS